MERIDELNINGKQVIQNTDYFLFGMDSVLVANIVKNTNKNMSVLDLGTGSGVIPIVLSEKTKVGKILGVELQSEMYDLAIRNIKHNGLEDKIQVFNLDMKNIQEIKEKIAEVTGKQTVDIVISNPPYKEEGTGSKNEGSVKYIARHEVSCKLEDVFKTASSVLKTKGKLYIVHKPERIVDLLVLARKYKLEAKKITFMQPTVKKSPSLVLIEYVLGGGNECKVTTSLIEFNEDGSYTKEIKEIYNEEE